MNKQTKIFGITPQVPTLIIRVLIEQDFGSQDIKVKQSLIRVVQRQAISEIIETSHGPEVTTQIKYLTDDGIFNTDELSGVGIATNDGEVAYIEMNFCSIQGSGTAHLIIPEKKYHAKESFKNKYLAMIMNHFAPERYAEEVKIDEIKSFLLDIFSQMCGSKGSQSSLEAS